MASSIPRPRASVTAAQGLSPVMKVPIGSRVVLSRRRNGTVKYVGKLTNESGEWYGVALDEPKGDSDGMRGKDRYFYCPPNHGVFVRRKEIYCTKEPGIVLKGPPSPVTDESSSCSSNVSTDQQGEVNGATVVHPAPTSTENAVSPLMKTFKGFRKQLDFISLKTVGPGRSREASPVASPTSSTPSSPTARSGLKPPSPFRRFASFSQGLPAPASPGSPTNKAVAAPTEYRRRQSGISLSPKTSPVRRTNSFRVSTPDSEDSIRPVETTSPSSSPNRFSSFQYSAIGHFSIAEDAANSPEVDAASTDSIEDGTTNLTEIIQAVSIEDERNSVQVLSAKSPRSQTDDAIVVPDERSAAPDIVNTVSANDEASVYQEITQNSQHDLTVASIGRTNAFHVPPIDISAITDTSEIGALEYSPASASVDFTQWSNHSSPIQETKSEDTPTIQTERTSSFRLSSIFQIPSIDVHQVLDSSRGSPSSSPESSPSRRSNSFAALSLDHIETLNDDTEDGQGSPTSSVVPIPQDNFSESLAASAPEPPVVSKLPPRSPRSRQEHTEVESLSPDKKLLEDAAGNGERPLFFRRMNVGRSPIERRSSYSSFSVSSSSPPRSPASSTTANAASRASRVSELEREISAMCSSHENIVAVLRATNKQHAANVLELRAQVAALTEGNLWLERQLTAKGELVRELREMEKLHQRDTVSVGEVKKILEIKDAQIQSLEREMAPLRQRLARLESDKDSQLYQQFQHYETRRARDEKRINELRKEVLTMCNERLELQSEVRDLKEMSLGFF